MKKTIKHYIRDFIVVLVSFSGLATLYRMYIKQKGSLVRILCFHDVLERKWFESVVSMLTQNYNMITPEEFHAQKFHPDKINLLLTFDDGYQSWVDVALPVLEEYDVKALFFISSGLLDVHGTEAQKDFVEKRLLLKPRKTLSWSGAERLRAAGHTIGGHSMNHRNLARLSQKKPEGLAGEIVDDKTALETKLHTTVTDFAYPFGRKEHFNTNVTKTVQEAGYSYLYSAETGFVSISTINTNRTLIESNQPLKSIKRWVEGSYDILCKIKN